MTTFSTEDINDIFNPQKTEGNRSAMPMQRTDPSAPYEKMLRGAAEQHGVPYEALKGIIKAESNFNPRAKNANSTATGIAQIIDSTANHLGVTDRFDPEQSIYGAAKYLKQHLNRFGGDLRKSVAAYNLGPEAVAKWGITNSSYVDSVLGNTGSVTDTTASPGGNSISPGLREQHLRLANMDLADRENMLNAMPTGSRPIHALRGNKESWYSPGQSKEFGTLAEAITGLTGGPTYAGEEGRSFHFEDKALTQKNKLAEETHKSDLQMEQARRINQMQKDLKPRAAAISIEDLLASENKNPAAKSKDDEEGSLWKTIKKLFDPYSDQNYDHDQYGTY